ncbi:hypothetical protein [Umezawaea beigongshangensis]|uniref:hypothetical protein n=1 Tax=Umezawaea beigongshangensis TaxID=2780383 RepID=UPI0018F1ABAC|nr:hypothetical protein [Umezawaea beigongshangensis]
MTQHVPEQRPDFAFGPDGTSWSVLLRSSGLGDGHASLITEPSADPQTVYPCEPELRAEDFQIPVGGLSAKQRKRALNALETYLVEKREHMVGFQGNQDMGHYQQDLGRFLEFHLNNVGDPFQEGNYKPNTKLVERAVLDHYAALWRANWPHNTGRPSPEDYWGYVLTMGSTEGNLYALSNARDYLSGKKLVTRPADGGEDGGQMMYVQTSPQARDADSAPGNRLRPVVFYSEDTHYSIVKAVRTLAIDTFGAVGRTEYPGECPLDGDWPMEVPSKGGADGSGEIDVAALVTLVEFFARKQHPVLLLLNFGTTFKGACDNVGKIAKRLYPVLRDNGLLERTFEFEPGRPDTRRGFWIHVDGALGAGYVPFLRIAAEREDELGRAVRREIRGGIPEFDFGLRVEGVDMVSSIVMSGHKWPGAPWPCGVFMTKNKFRVEPPSVPAYTGSPDTTFAGSRNGLSPLVLWDHLAQKSVEEHAATAVRALRLTRYLETQLRELEDLLDREDRLPEEGLYVNRSPMALTVRFRRPNPRIVDKWSLSCQPMLMNSGRLRDYAHIFVMPSVTEEKIDAFVEDLTAPGAFDRPAPVVAPVQPAAPAALADDVRALALVPTIGRGFQ